MVWKLPSKQPVKPSMVVCELASAMSATNLYFPFMSVIWESDVISTTLRKSTISDAGSEGELLR